MAIGALTVNGARSAGGIARYAPAPVRVAITLMAGLGVALAIASALALAIVLSLVAVHASLELPPIRRRYARWQTDHQRKRRSAKLALRLERAGAPRADLAELAAIAKIVHETADASSADAFGLDELLDRYVELAVARQRCLVALARADLPRLEGRLPVARQEQAKTAGVLERRMKHALTLARRLREIEDALEELGELIRYGGDRAIAPEVDRLIEGDIAPAVLDRYDALDAANHELSQGVCDGESQP